MQTIPIDIGPEQVNRRTTDLVRTSHLERSALNFAKLIITVIGTLLSVVIPYLYTTAIFHPYIVTLKLQHGRIGIISAADGMLCHVSKKRNNLIISWFR